MPEVRATPPRRSNPLRKLLLVLVSFVGLSTLAAFAFAAGGHHRFLSANDVRGVAATSRSPDSLNSLLDNTGQSVGSYCPIPPRGQPDHGTPKKPAPGDALLANGQSIVPDSTGAAICPGTAAPPPLRAPKSDR